MAGWGVAATALSATIDGVKLPAIADVSGLADLGLPTLEGELPRNDHEVALGSTSAERLDVSVGDQVTVETDFGERDAMVTGIVVLPSIGAFLSDRAGLGTGILLLGAVLQGGGQHRRDGCGCSRLARSTTRSAGSWPSIFATAPMPRLHRRARTTRSPVGTSSDESPRCTSIRCGLRRSPISTP